MPKQESKTKPGVSQIDGTADPNPTTKPNGIREDEDDRGVKAVSVDSRRSLQIEGGELAQGGQREA